MAYVGGFLPFLDPLHAIKTFSARFPARFPTRLPTAFQARISCKNFPQDFPQDFPARFSHKNFPQDFPELDPDWLAPHHPIPNAKFPAITALLNRPTYHKSAKVSPPPFPQISWEPQVNEKLTLNEPATRPELRKKNRMSTHCSKEPPQWLTCTKTRGYALYQTLSTLGLHHVGMRMVDLPLTICAEP